jgi:hypothetical protein
MNVKIREVTMNKIFAFLVLGFQITVMPVYAIHYGTDPVHEESEVEEEIFG